MRICSLTPDELLLKSQRKADLGKKQGAKERTEKTLRDTHQKLVHAHGNALVEYLV